MLNRNTRRRVEVFVPVKNDNEKKNILKILEFCRKDNKKGWIMCPDAVYTKEYIFKDAVNSQLFFEKYFSEIPKISYKKQNIFGLMTKKI